MWGRAKRTQTSTSESHSMFFAKYVLYHNVATTTKQTNQPQAQTGHLKNTYCQIHLHLSDSYKGHIFLVLFFGVGELKVIKLEFEEGEEMETRKLRFSLKLKF